MPTPCLLTEASTLNATSGASPEMIRWMQLRRAANHVVVDVGYDDRAVSGASGSIAFNKPVIEEAIKAIMPACCIEPQQMITQ